MSDYPINVFYSSQDGDYIADIPDLKYCSAFGETHEEALREALPAKAAWLETTGDLSTGFLARRQQRISPTLRPPGACRAGRGRA